MVRSNALRCRRLSGSASLILLVVRSGLTLFASKPSRRLVLAAVAVVLATAALPCRPHADLRGLVPLLLPYLALIGAVVVLYIGAAKPSKRLFYRRFDRAPAVPA